jgi:hypothetical protein
MTSPPGSTAETLEFRVGETIVTSPRLGARVSAKWAQTALAVATVPMVAVTIWLALRATTSSGRLPARCTGAI